MLEGTVKENIAPYLRGTLVTERFAPVGEKFYVIEGVRQEIPGGWGSSKQYASLTEARRELALLPEFKDGNLVMREYTVTKPAPVRQGVAGPQVSKWDGQTYAGGGKQIEFMFDRGTKDNPAWKLYMTETGKFSLQ